MYYTIAKVAEKVGISKSAVYKKIKTNELKPYISKKQGVTFISENGLKLIQSGINDFVNECKEVEPELQEIAENKDFKSENKAVENIETDSRYLKHLENEVDRLWAELEEKNNQISKLSRLVENGQVLLREQPKQNIELLQEHFDELDGKIIEIRERMHLKQANHEADHQSFWNKLFSKKKDY